MTEYINDFIKKNKYTIFDGKYQKLFDECDCRCRTELVEILTKADIQFIDKMERIPSSMFKNSKLTGKFVIPSNIHTIRHNAFRNSNFDEIFIENPIEPEFYLEEDCFANMQQLKKVRLPNKLKKIPGFNFYYCSQLKYIEIPEGVEYIGSGAFKGSGLTQIRLPSTIKKIGELAFDNDGPIKVLYNGTLDQWQKVKINDRGNDKLVVKYLK